MKKRKGEIIEIERAVVNVCVPFYKKNIQPHSHEVDLQHKEVYTCSKNSMINVENKAIHWWVFWCFSSEWCMTLYFRTTQRHACIKAIKRVMQVKAFSQPNCRNRVQLPKFHTKLNPNFLQNWIKLNQNILVWFYLVYS